LFHVKFCLGLQALQVWTCLWCKPPYCGIQATDRGNSSCKPSHNDSRDNRKWKDYSGSTVHSGRACQGSVSEYQSFNLL